jgi:hypothetical protein
MPEYGHINKARISVGWKRRKMCARIFAWPYLVLMQTANNVQLRFIDFYSLSQISWS